MILVDSNLFIALTNQYDQWHEQSIKILSDIENEKKIIADVVILESINLVGSLLGGEIVKQLYDNIKDNYSIYATNELYDEAMISYLHYDGFLSLTDVLLLKIMEDLQIDRIVSFDSDFDKIKGIKRIH